MDCKSATNKKSGAADNDKKGGSSSRCHICGSEKHLAHMNSDLCKIFEHRTRDCEECGAEKGAILAKLNVPVRSEDGEIAAMVGTARSDRKEKWESDSGVTFHVSHTRHGMLNYNKASPGTTVEVADGYDLPVDGFRRIEVDLDLPRSTTRMVRMDDTAYVSGPARNLMSTLNAVEHWGKPLVHYRTKALLRFPGDESVVFNFCPRKD